MGRFCKTNFFSRFHLCARGFYATPNRLDADLTQNWATYKYFTPDVAVAEIELDVLRGDWHLLRVEYTYAM
jgi:xanthine dehydrogenase molybdopterin-binding subunit B